MLNTIITYILGILSKTMWDKLQIYKDVTKTCIRMLLLCQNYVSKPNYYGPTRTKSPGGDFTFKLKEEDFLGRRIKYHAELYDTAYIEFCINKLTNESILPRHLRELFTRAEYICRTLYFLRAGSLYTWTDIYKFKEQHKELILGHGKILSLLKNYRWYNYCIDFNKYKKYDDDIERAYNKAKEYLEK